MLKKLSAVLFSSVILFTGLSQAGTFKVPALTGPVIDEAGILRDEDAQRLDAVLRDYNHQGKAQIQVYITSSLQGLEIEEASIQIAEQWKLGSAKTDNGILFLIAPHERRLRIEVGRGLEGTLPDVIAKRIIEDVVKPYFRNGQMSTGVVAGVSQILKYVDQEYADQHLPAPQDDEDHGRIPGWLVILILLLIIGGGRFLPFFWIGGGGFGGGGFGGGGGGGWSGGGGGFNGGGSSGSW